MTRANWRDVCLDPDTPLEDVIRRITETAKQIALVAGDDHKLLGTITDGDIRRGILRGLSLDTPAREIMKENPIVAGPDLARDVLLGYMRDGRVKQLPIVDAQGFLVGLELLDDMLSAPDADNWIVIMAGGLGTRLRPITEDIPKPLVPVGGRPVLETIIEQLAGQGFTRIFLAVNYLAEQVRDHFGDGSRWDVQIDYLEEETRLGTAGALTLLPHRPPAPFLVMNADLVTDIDFRRLLNFHGDQTADATMCVREYKFQVPYGVVETQGNRITQLTEKPQHSYFVNSGIYALEPDVLDLVPDGHFYDMTTLFDDLLAREGHGVVFPVHEYWIDIGQFDDLERARTDFSNVFTPKGKRA
ncbi:nucleotidyltransferase family protein [Pyruvatibacter sp. HU-CL02332]|uniref:nucleotidyltransferase family protein n=1 Tax=Pyruvatibacter sp. HU-CL02332 TaxID=3127650 RepID=UPI0031042F3D